MEQYFAMGTSHCLDQGVVWYKCLNVNESTDGVFIQSFKPWNTIRLFRLKKIGISSSSYYER